MSINIFDFGGFPTKEEREVIEKGMPHLDQIILNINPNQYSTARKVEFFYSLKEFKSWLRHFNNKIVGITHSYIMVIYYYNMGIPDEEWNQLPEKTGESIQYFPNFKDEHYCIKYFFNYYLDVFYHKLFGAWDSMCHLINIFYGMNIKTGSGFNGKVMEELKNHDLDLYNYLQGVINNEIYKKANQIRNNLTHNYPPNDIDSGIERLDSGITIYTVGNYTTSKNLKENMNNIIKLLNKTNKKLKVYFSPR